MWKRLFTPDQGDNPGKENISSWDVVVLSFKLLFQQIQFWIRPNIWMVLLSIPVLTAPAAKAALYQTTATALRDPALIHTRPWQEIRKGFLGNIWRALGLTLIKWGVAAVILVSLWFWTTQETWLLRSVSIISFYGLVLWWLAVGYLHPSLVENPENSLYLVVKEAVTLAFQRPFDSLLFAVVSTLLNILGLALLGPILLVIPVLRSILHMHGYWYLTGRVIPGFMNLAEYTEKYYD